MIEHAKLSTRDATFSLSYSGKYSYLIGDSGTRKMLLVNLLGQVLRGYRATMEGSRKIVGGPGGIAIDHLDDENVLLVFGEDYDVPSIDDYYLDMIKKSPNPCIFITRDIVPGIPYTDENVFAMQRISSKEFTMVPVLGGVSSATSILRITQQIGEA